MVEWHLRKVFAKLGIRSHQDLSRALPSSDSELVPPRERTGRRNPRTVG